MRDRVLSYGCLACGGVGGDHHALTAFGELLGFLGTIEDYKTAPCDDD